MCVSVLPVPFTCSLMSVSDGIQMVERDICMAFVLSSLLSMRETVSLVSSR